MLARSLASPDDGAALPFNDDVTGAAGELATVALDTLERAMRDGWVSLVGSGDPRGDGETARLGRAGLVPARMYAGPLGVSGGGEGG